MINLLDILIIFTGLFLLGFVGPFVVNTMVKLYNFSFRQNVEVDCYKWVERKLNIDIVATNFVLGIIACVLLMVAGAVGEEFGKEALYAPLFSAAWFLILCIPHTLRLLVDLKGSLKFNIKRGNAERIDEMERKVSVLEEKLKQSNGVGNKSNFTTKI